jgi:arylsulfatase A-like enzyme
MKTKTGVALASSLCALALLVLAPNAQGMPATKLGNSPSGGLSAPSLAVETTTPSPPVVTDTDPDSPANDNAPSVKGIADAGSTVLLYAGSDCSGDAAATGSAEDFASPGLTVSVADDSTTSFSATATDSAGSVSECSPSSIAYVEDSTPPAPPDLTDTDPDSPAAENSPNVKGAAEDGSVVQLFKAATTSDCASPTWAATGSAADFTSPGLQVSVPDDSSTTFRATATDAAGNTSGCSESSIAYVQVPAACDLFASRTDGADPPVGDGLATPFRTVQQLADALSPGQTGCVRGYARGSTPDASTGLYSEDVTIANGGSSNLDRIIIRSAPGEVAQLKGRLLVTASFVTVSHLVLDGRNASNLASPTVEGSDVTFSDDNITSRNTVDCFQVGHNGRLLRNRIRNCRIGIRIGDFSATIQENLVYENSEEGISFAPSARAAAVHKNIVDGNGFGIRFEGDSSQAADQNEVTKSIVSFSRRGYNVRTSFDPAATGFNYLAGSCFWSGVAAYSGSPPSSGIDPSAYDQDVTVTDATVANPAYAARSSKNFHITSQSPCYDRTGDIAQAVDGGGGPSDRDAMNLRPNVLFVVTDDQRLVGTMAYMPKTLKWFKSGAALAGIAGGTEFANGFVTTPLCCPSRASILTGQYAHNHGAEREDVAGTIFSQSADNAIDDQYPMLQRYLADPDTVKGLGYETAIFGKYLNGWDPCAAPPAPTQPPNFDRYAVFSTGPYVNFFANDQGTAYGCGSVPRIAQYSTSWISNKAQTFIDEAEASDSRPWFMYIAPKAPHTSTGFYGETPPVPEPGKYDTSTYPRSAFGSQGPNPALCESRTQLNDNPRSVRSAAGQLPDWMKLQSFKDEYPAPAVSCKTTPAAADVAREREVQLRTLKSVDDLVEAVFQKLSTDGEQEDTLAFFISDNGWLWGEHGLHTKNRPYTESIQVPFFMRWPGNSAVKRGFRDSRLAANIDLTPTVLDALDVVPDPTNPPDGKSLLRATTHTALLAESWHTENGVNVPFWASIRTPSYQYIESYASPDSEQSPYREYYDLSSNPWEVFNSYGRDGRYGGGDDRGAPPSPPVSQLSAYRMCKGETCP